MTIKTIIVCAFHPEALAIIQHFGLKKLSQCRPFDFYSNDTIGLVECGLGNIAAASAVSYIAGKYHDTKFSWLNVGIGGHRSLHCGEGYLINKVIDNNTKHNYYPDFSSNLDISSKRAINVIQVESHYNEDAIYEMESVGFLSGATRHSPIELCQCYKIISDNKQNPAEQIDRKDIVGLVNSNIHSIENIVDNLMNKINSYRDIYSEPVEIDTYANHFHFSQTQHFQLSSLIKRWNATCKKPFLQAFPISQYSSAKLLLATVDTQLNNAKF